MKIRHRIFLLLVVPLVCQLITVGLLGSSFAVVDRNAERETIAKRVVTLAEEINILLAREMLETTRTSVFEQRPRAEAREQEAIRQIREKTGELEAIVKTNPKLSSVVSRFRRNCIRFAENWEDIGKAYPDTRSFSLSQFLEREDMVESMKVLFDELDEDSSKLLKEYGTVAREFQPVALQQRTALRNITAITIGITVVLVLVIALIINKSTLGRLNILMNNIKKFSQGEKGLTALPGEDELAELDKAFRDMSDQRNRLEEIRNSMRAMVSHDIRSPLTSINIRLDLMIEKYRDSMDPEIRLQLIRLYAESQRLVRLATTLLDVEKLEDGCVDVKIIEHTASEIVEQALDSIQTQAEQKHLKIENAVDADHLIHCDQDRTIQVIVNLLSNAVKFAPNGTTVTITSEWLEADGKGLTAPVDSTAGGGTIKFSVLDEGPGVPEAEIGQLFSKFRQLEQKDETKQQGSGLGLYICKMLVQAQGGTIGYDSRPEGGSSFWFELPAA